jgi:hypothetical protein
MAGLFGSLMGAPSVQAPPPGTAPPPATTTPPAPPAPPVQGDTTPRDYPKGAPLLPRPRPVEDPSIRPDSAEGGDTADPSQTSDTGASPQRFRTQPVLPGPTEGGDVGTGPDPRKKRKKTMLNMYYDVG